MELLVRSTGDGIGYIPPFPHKQNWELRATSYAGVSTLPYQPPHWHSTQFPMDAKLLKTS